MACVSSEMRTQQYIRRAAILAHGFAKQIFFL
jgi:hypothetical protein